MSEKADLLVVDIVLSELHDGLLLFDLSDICFSSYLPRLVKIGHLKEPKSMITRDLATAEVK